MPDQTNTCPAPPGCRRRVARAWRCVLLGACAAAQWASAAAGLPAVEPPPEPPASAEQFADEVLQRVNQLREPLGLSRLQAAPTLTRIAAARSQEMAQAGRLSHAGFSAAFEASGRPACVENLAFGYRQPAALVAAWQASASHQRNLVAPGLQQAGVVLQAGYATFFACR